MSNKSQGIDPFILVCIIVIIASFYMAFKVPYKDDKNSEEKEKKIERINYDENLSKPSSSCENSIIEVNGQKFKLVKI